jgi:hypothetical protein
MKNKLFTFLTAATLAVSVALSPVALARGGGGGGGMHGGFGGGMHGGGMAFAAMGGGGHFAGGHFGGGPRFAGAGFHGGRFFHHGGFFRHHRFHRFAFVGGPYVYADYYGGCWRRTWTSYGLQWVNVCGDYW